MYREKKHRFSMKLFMASTGSVLAHGMPAAVQSSGEAALTAWVPAVDAQNVSWDQDAKEACVLVLPEGTIQLEPGVVPSKGEHWANPTAGELPNGPIYGVYNGKLVFLEYMIDQQRFVEGKSYVNLNGMKGAPP